MKWIENADLWVIRPNPNNIDRMDEFKENNVVAIGWPRLGDLEHQSHKDIKDKLTKLFPEKSKRSINLQFGMIKRFKEEIKVGDIIVVPESGSNKVHFARVDSDYFFNDNNKKDGFPHQRKVSWILKDINKDKLPEKMQDGLRPIMTLYSLDKYEQEFKSWIISKEMNQVTLKDAVHIKVILSNTFFEPELQRVYKIAESAIPDRLKKKSEEIYEQAKPLLSDGRWSGPEHRNEFVLSNRIGESDFSWLDEIL